MALALSDARSWYPSYQLDQEAKGFSARTVSGAANAWRQFVRYAAAEGRDLSPESLRAFLAHLRRQGRKPGTLRTYRSALRVYCRWLKEEGATDEDLCAGVQPVTVRQDQIQPLSPDQVRDLLRATKGRSDRDRLLVLLLLDTGCRISEACALRVQDVRLPDRSIRIAGKGGKSRTVYYGREVSRLLVRWIRERKMAADHCLFPAFDEHSPTRGLSRQSAHRMIAGLGRQAHLQGVRVSPHTLRHTFAVSFLRGGGSPFALRSLLGHSDMNMVMRYVALAQEDIAAEHRKASPGDRLGA